MSCSLSAVAWYCLDAPSISSTFFSNLASSSSAASSRESFWEVSECRMSLSFERCWAILVTSSSRSLFSSSTLLRSSAARCRSSCFSDDLRSTASLCSRSFSMRDSNLLMSLSRSAFFCCRASRGVGLCVSPEMDDLSPSISASLLSTSSATPRSLSSKLDLSSSSSAKHSPSSPARKLL